MSESNDIVAALAPVVEAFNHLGIRYYVGGSVASSYHGAMRTTMDVDVVADIEEEHMNRLLDSLGDAYYASVPAIRNAIRRRSAFNLIHLDTGFKVDVFTNRKRSFDESAFRRTVVGDLGDERVFKVPICSAEDSIVSKLEWYRIGGEVSERQWNDVLTMVKLLGAALDMDYLASASQELGVADLFERIVREARA